jgi:arylsulfatase A-like enzyme/tetratricopeptide (TPR) repeat protein
MNLKGWFAWAGLAWSLTLGSSAILAGTRAPSVILISVDTLRADRLGCYGGRREVTPHIDAIAQNGTLFSQVSSQVPLTLPSHVSLFTSTSPFFNGVQDNGQRLAANTITLATVLKSEGYRTAAFVGSFVLDRRFGLSQGFDFYDSPFDLHRRSGADAADAKRPGQEVVDSAIHWIDSNPQGAFFLFLHLYDLHKPYDLPASWPRRAGIAEGYEAQLAYEDEVLGGFWSFLSDRGLLQKSLIVFTSDHGEGLGDHGESTHGYFVYQSTLRVPLIISWPPGGGTLAARVDEPASLLDVAPTILQFLGLKLPSTFQGRSLLQLANQKQPSSNTEIYSESLFARDHFGCDALFSWRQGQFKYIEAPKPELYDLAKDPGESHNLYSSKKSLALALRERMLAFKARFQERAPSATALSAEAEATLRSLGYLAISTPRGHTSPSGVDPKDRIVEAETFHFAVALAASGKLEEANRLLEGLRLRLPEVAAIPMSLGLNLQKLGEHRKAAENFRAALALDSANAEAYSSLAASSLALDQEDEAAKELRAVLAIDPEHSRAYRLLGVIGMQRKDYARARECFNHMLAIAPEDYEAHYQLGILATLEEKWQEAELQLLAALKTDPNSPEACNALGSVYFRLGNLSGANDAFSKAIQLEPRFAWAHYNLGLVLHQQAKNEEAARHFRQALAVDPQLQPARQALASIDVRRK